MKTPTPSLLSTEVFPGADPSSGFTHRIRTALTVLNDVETAESFCTNIANLQRLLPMGLQLNGDEASQLVAVFTAENGKSISWIGSYSSDTATNSLKWLSKPGSEVKAKGQITFREAPGGESTEICLLLDYTPPTGGLHRYLPKENDANPPASAKKVLQNFRALLECGELATIKGQSRGH